MVSTLRDSLSAEKKPQSVVFSLLKSAVVTHFSSVRPIHIGQFILITLIQTYLFRIGVSANYRKTASQKGVVRITASQP
jgi:hypothetical protein